MRLTTDPRKYLAAAMPVMTLAAGCAAGPNYRQPDSASLTPTAYAVPDAALGAAHFPGGPAKDVWWRAFSDPLLDELIAQSLRDNPDLAAAEARVREARALASVAGAERWPSLSATARAGRDKLSRNGENLALIPFRPPTTEFSDYRAGFDASWELDFAGHARRTAEAAQARADSSVESRNAARVVVAAEVAGSYIDYRVYAERFDLARRSADSFAETERLTRLSEQAGLASTAERLRAEADAASAQAVVPPLEAAGRAALFRLAALSGEAAQTLAQRLAAPQPVPAPPEAVPVGLPAELLRRRPDVRRVERELAAATADVGVAVAAQFPRLTLVGDFGWDSVHSGSLTAAASQYWNAGPQLSIPLFAGGRLRAQADAARAARAAALASYRATVLGAFADTESALIRYANQRRRSINLASTERALESAVVLQQQRVAAGDASRLELLAAERSLEQAADQRTEGSGQAALDFVALQKSLGGGWQRP